MSTLDPQVLFDNVSSAVVGNVCETLVHFDRSLRLSPGLALRWINPDECTWRLSLDASARFSDGAPLRSADVKASIERVQSLPSSDLQGFTRHIEGVDVVDDLTVDLRTDRPLAILNDLAFIPILSERQIRLAPGEIPERPLGTGPLKVVGRVADRSIHLAVNEHHRPRPEMQEVVFEICQGQALLDSIVRTGPDLALFLGQTALQGLVGREVPGLELVSSPGLYVFYAALNVRSRVPGRAGSNPLSDARVRRALALATDQSQIIREDRHSLARPVTQLVVPEVFGFDPGILPAAPDPVAARRLLAEAGHSGLQLAILASEQASPGIDQLLAEQWGRAGVRLSREVRSAELVEGALEAGSFQVTVQGWGCTSADAHEVLSFLLQGRDPAQGAGALNYTGFVDAEIQRITSTNLGVFDPKERLRMLQRALRVAAEQNPYIPLYSDHETHVVSETVRWTPRIDGEFRIGEVSFRNGPAATEDGR